MGLLKVILVCRDLASNDINQGMDPLNTITGGGRSYRLIFQGVISKHSKPIYTRKAIFSIL